MTPSKGQADSLPTSPSTSEVAAVIGNFKGDVLKNDAKKTYHLPDIGVFAAFYPKHSDLATGMLVELYDRRHRSGLFNWFKYDLAVSEQRIGLAIGRKLYPVIDVTVSAIFSRDLRRDENTWGLAVSLVKF